MGQPAPRASRFDDAWRAAAMVPEHESLRVACLRGEQNLLNDVASPSLEDVTAGLGARPTYPLEALPGQVSLKLDAHVPEGRGPFPAVILVHGGGWNAGTKTANFVKPLFPVLDSTGYVWFTIDYRLSPQHVFPSSADDVESAIT